ncbi:pentatricopeptide repeat-containing protein At4g04790, mitochondrial-like [Prunus avium]|uniref:Pentatricopeptide repeat-containing protein At4g04790, mitochondrial-like n=1 Tax=Prunus avium TaxID=42229 RepID=A0A6P5U4T6_PRUAV|nr:pentatricopeptide repeat-containing protein At4g04790, mitochondrial-like [Prunus avium]
MHCVGNPAIASFICTYVLLEGNILFDIYCYGLKTNPTPLSLLKFCTDELALEVIFNQVFALIAESESTHLQLGLDLLHAIKNELGLTPSRKCLDFLLNACANAKDLRNSLLIWKEYETAGLPYNTLSFIRMYQALLAAGDRKASKILLSKIPKDDPHVRTIIKACKTIYS